MTNNVRRPLFDGMREIHAIWFDAGLIGEAQARARVLCHWQVGARLHRAEGGYLLTLARPRMAHCGQLDGLALCKVGAILSSAPLAADETQGIGVGTCYLVRGAQAHALTLTDAELADPAAWIDLSAIALRMPLKFPELKARVTLDAPDQAKPLREILGNVVGAPSEQREALMRALRGEPEVHKQGGFNLAATAARILGAAGLAGAACAGVLAGMLARLLVRAAGGAGTGGGLGSGSGSGQASGGGSDGAVGKSGPQPESAWKKRLMAAATRLAMLTRASKVIGWRQSAYLKKMIETFENGDLAEALRHAIPLDGDAMGDKRQALGALHARTSLEITARGGTSTVIGLQDELKDYLRKSYRKMFERLDREERIDEATFVLAELLNAGVEAVDYLERKGRLRQAAELAETLKLEPQILVRLWILAGDAPRAVRIARLYGAFGEAVRQLERKQSEHAEPLRLLWAEYLVDRGDLIDAAEVIWPIEKYRMLALTWLVQAEQTGRPLGARALVRKLALMPDSLADSATAVYALLENQSHEGPELRATLASELAALEQQSEATSRVAAEVLRYVVAERNAGLNQLDKPTFNKLLGLKHVGMIKSDLPTLKFAAASALASSAGQPAGVLQVQASEAGQLQIHDARRLPGGHYLIALGESGVVRLNALGRQLAHFPLPAYHLVLSTNGERALALARRGDVIRASRIDLTTGRLSDWLSQPFDSWADQFDGVVWNAVIENRVVAIDTSKDQLSVIWQVADLPGKVIDFIDDGVNQTILMAKERELEQWRYTLPARRLSQRDAVPFPPEGVTQVLAHNGSMAPLLVQVGQDQSGFSLAVKRANGVSLTVPLGAVTDNIRAEVKDGWLLVYAAEADGVMVCRVVERQINRVIAELRMQDTVHARAAAHDGHVLLFDRKGRLIDLDVSRGVAKCLTFS